VYDKVTVRVVRKPHHRLSEMIERTDLSGVTESDAVVPMGVAQGGGAEPRDKLTGKQVKGGKEG
jgi:hypothetical protein